MKNNIKTVVIHVNDKEIELNNFVTALFGNTIVGMVSSLNLDQPPERIKICVEVQPGKKEN